MKVKNLLWLTIGVIAGGAGMFFYANKKYKERLSDKQEKIDAITELYKEAKKKNETPYAWGCDLGQEVKIAELYAKEVAAYNEDVKRLVQKFVIGPHEVEANEYDNLDYDEICLTYFVNNDVLADENNSEIGNPEAMVGVGTMESLLNENAAVIYAANDELEIKYEIAIDGRDYYQEVVANWPPSRQEAEHGTDD